MISDLELEKLPQLIETSIGSKSMPGFGNMGNTCFANSVLQCLGHTPYLVEYCMLQRHSRNCQFNKLETDISQRLVIEMPKRYTASKLMNIPVVQALMKDKKESVAFCAFCVFERHIIDTIKQRDSSNFEVLPLCVLPFLERIGTKNQFELGKQSDS